ncbi:hypothetical protein MLD38_008375 [Melastoma candidum]|nr:hypothetical protein MLD38_008375 [Melastoma candidum]
MRHMMMHMTFFWGKNTEVLFDKWPGRSTGMYVLALAVVFVLCFIVEWLSHSRLLKHRPENKVAVGMVQTGMHTVRMGVAYMAMLAVMSFNGGVFLAAVAGHAVGFMVFGSTVFGKETSENKTRDLPPMRC